MQSLALATSNFLLSLFSFPYWVHQVFFRSFPKLLPSHSDVVFLWFFYYLFIYYLSFYLLTSWQRELEKRMMGDNKIQKNAKIN